jgi:hypothetical protein
MKINPKDLGANRASTSQTFRILKTLNSAPS